MQGIGWIVRKAISMSKVTLTVTQYEGPPSPPSESTEAVTHIDIEQTTTAGYKGTSEKRCIDGLWREHSDWLFGQVKGQTTWVKLEDIKDTYLAKGWEEGDAEKSGPNGETHLRSYVESIGSDWTAEQIWGFQIVNGVRMYARNIVVKVKKGDEAKGDDENADDDKADERVDMRLVYKYES